MSDWYVCSASCVIIDSAFIHESRKKIIGPEANMLEPSEEQCHRLILPQPILSLSDLEVLKATRHRGWRVKMRLIN